MLKITLHDSASELRFRLEGRLCGLWAGELRQCWRTAASASGARRTVVDLSEVDFVDSAGRELLQEMHRQGVRFRAVTPIITALLDEVTRAPGCGTVEGTPPERSNAFASSHPPGRNSRAV
jgi:anti-anti-sigma regulatory factor